MGQVAGRAGPFFLTPILDKHAALVHGTSFTPIALASPQTGQNTQYTKQKQAVLTEDGKPGGTLRTFFVCTSERK